MGLYNYLMDNVEQSTCLVCDFIVTPINANPTLDGFEYLYNNHRWSLLWDSQ